MLSAFDCFLRYGIKSVSMDDLAKRLGISKKTIYNYISNKNELVEETVSEHMSINQAEIDKLLHSGDNAIESMIAIAKHNIDFLQKMKPGFLFDLQKYHGAFWLNLEAERNQHIEQTISTNMQIGIEQGLYSQRFDPKIIAKLFVGLVTTMIDEDIFPPNEFSKSEIFVETIRYHMRGIVTDKGRSILQQIEI